MSRLSLSTNLVETLGVPGVGSFARTGRAAVGSSEAVSTTLSIESSTDSSTGSWRSSWLGNRDTDGRQGGRLGSSRCGGGFLFGRSGSLGRRGTGAGSTSPDSRAGHGEILAAVVD